MAAFFFFKYQLGFGLSAGCQLFLKRLLSWYILVSNIYLYLRKKIDAMLSSVVCRTCEVDNASNLHRLTTHTEKYPEKMLSDLLFELAIIDPKMENSDWLPQELCGTCTRKLKNAYYFVVQARETQYKLLDLLKSSDKSTKPLVSNADCLQESPMDVFVESLVEVKIEDEASEEPAEDLSEPSHYKSIVDINSDNNDKSFDPLSKFEKSDSSSNEDELDDLPLQQRKNIKKESSESIQKKKAGIERIYKCDKCDKSYYWPQNLRLHKRKHFSKEDWLVCPHCSQKFSRKDSLSAHLKKHGEQNINKRPANLCERKQAKDIDINMCKPNGCKLIQCMICLGKYSNFVELKSHMEEHQENVSFSSREIAESLYPDVKEMSEEDLIERVRRDLKAKKYSLFYSITNESGYELSLDSSETESELDHDADEIPKYANKTGKNKSTYNCELCTACYHRKYQLFEHQREQHAWLEAPHTCSRCDARFVSVKLLEHHYKSQCKNSQKRLICRKCPLRFRWKHNLKSHYRDHKIKKQTFECMDCGRVYDDKKSYSIHKLTVHTHQSNLMPCQWCDRKFYRRDYMLKHLKRHGIMERDLPLAKTHIVATAKPNGVKSIKCKVCNITFDRIADLRNHLQLESKLALSMHQNDNSMLNYSITNESGFELHLDDSETDGEEVSFSSNHKVNRIYTCELCKVQCRRKYELMQHQRAMHRFDILPFACESCIFKTVSKDVFEYHKRTQCSNMEKQHACGKCGYKFMWPENLDTHLKLQHSNEAGLASNNSSQVTACDEHSGTSIANLSSNAHQLALKCPHCDRTYIMQSRLKNHIRDVHIDGDRKKKEAQKKFLCSLCGKETQSAANLVTHMRRHTGEKPFKCDLCEMAFPRHSEMLSHRRKHTGEKPYHCTVCGKNFARSDKLKRHMLTHSGLKPYKCTYCDKCYRQSKDLAIHMQQHTGECPFACGTCGERFLQSTTLEKHRMMRGHFNETQ